MSTSESAFLDASIFGLVHIVSETLTLHSIEHRWYHSDYASSFASMEEASEFFDFEIGTPQSMGIGLDELVSFHICRECNKALNSIDKLIPHVQSIRFPCPTRRIISRTLGTDDSSTVLCSMCWLDGDK